MKLNKISSRQENPTDDGTNLRPNIADGQTSHIKYSETEGAPFQLERPLSASCRKKTFSFVSSPRENSTKLGLFKKQHKYVALPSSFCLSVSIAISLFCQAQTNFSSPGCCDIHFCFIVVC